MTKAIEGAGLRKLGGNIVLTFTRQIFAALIALGTFSLIGRMLGPAGNGIFNMAILLPTFLMTLGTLGIDQSTTYFTSRRDFSLRTIVLGNFNLTTVLSVIVCAAGAALVLSAPERFFPNVPPALLLLGLLAVPPLLLLLFWKSVFQGTQEFKQFNFLSLLPQLLQLGFTLACVALFDLGVTGAILAYFLAQLVSAIVAWWLVKPMTVASAANQAAERSAYYRQSIRYGWKAHVSGVLTFSNRRMSLYLVNLFVTPAAVGLYSVAVQLGEALWMWPQSISLALLPRVAELKDDEAKRRIVTPTISRINLVSSLLIGVVAYFVAPYFIPLLFGVAFTDAAQAFRWLLPGILASGFSRVLTNDILARGRVDITLYLSLVVVILTVGGNLLLLPSMGILGAALTTSITGIVNAVIRLFIYCKLASVPWWQPICSPRQDWQMLTRLMRERGAVKTTPV